MGLYTISRRVVRSIGGESTVVKLEPGLRRVLRIWYAGKRHVCPCCQARLRRFVTDRRLCPACGSGPRHRLQWLYLEKEYGLFGHKDCILDIAPWRYFQRYCLKYTNLRYHSIDISSRWAMERGDITAMPYREGSYQIILCSHVLEHIPNDEAAMREMYRVLVPGGIALIQVPLAGERTFEAPAARSTEDRERLYGRADHVRIYGSDIGDRLGGAGFEVKMVPYGAQYDQPEQVRYGLDPEEMLIIGKKVEQGA